MHRGQPVNLGGRARSVALSLTAAVLLGSCASGDGVQSLKMAAVRQRNLLLCGTNGKLPGFSYVASDGSYRGLDVDVCKAIAAAVLGDPNKVEFRELTPAERFTALASGEVDLLSRNTSVSLSRDAAGGNNLAFAPIVFYDGQGIMVPRSSGISGLKDLDGKAVCVLSGTTSELNLANRLREQGIRYTPLKYQTVDQTFAAYLQGRCVAVTSDRSGLAAKRSSFPQPNAHVVLPALMSKEPLAPASSAADTAWADALRWIIFGLIEAEEVGITQANVVGKVAEARANPNRSELRRLLGVEGEFGRQLGLAPDFVVRSVKAVGNYGELFERNVGRGSPIRLERGPNRLWNQGGLLYSPPFR
ncbi:MAG: amino acid ABC transporter substrate-binding protein [Cyanobacteriota bacterium]|nr:amino acid ABC transporter substrate-binding protein [Cyanobacteriota bacterium]